MDQYDNVCICCSMPSIDSLCNMNRRKIFGTDVPITALDAYNRCSGIKTSDFPHPLNDNPKICVICAMQLEFSYKFYNLCHQTKAKFNFKQAQYSACRACACADLMDENELHDMEEKDFVHNTKVTKCIDAFNEFTGLAECKTIEFYKICQTCFGQLENAFMFQSFCQHAFKILKRKYEKKMIPVASVTPIIEIKDDILENIKEEEPFVISDNVFDVPDHFDYSSNDTQPPIPVLTTVQIISPGKRKKKGSSKKENTAEPPKKDVEHPKRAQPVTRSLKENTTSTLGEVIKNPKKAQPVTQSLDEEKVVKTRKKRLTPKKNIVSPPKKVIKNPKKKQPVTKSLEIPSIKQEPTAAPLNLDSDTEIVKKQELPSATVDKRARKSAIKKEFTRAGWRDCKTETEYRNALKRTKAERAILDGLYECELCSRTFKTLTTIKVHMEKHLFGVLIDAKKLVEKDNLCNMCGKLFHSKSKLQFHMEVHGNEKHKCTICSTIYTHKKDLKRHMFSHTGGREGFANCPLCKKSLKIGSVETHIQIVHITKKHKCEQCGMSFETKEKIWRHKFDHLGYLPYNCPEVDNDGVICAFNSKKRQMFETHLLKKHNIKYVESLHGYNDNRSEFSKELHAEKMEIKKPYNYRCDKCSKGFQTYTGLYHHRQLEHLNVHFQCGWCDKSFTQKPSLWSHSFTHRDFFPFNCVQFGCSYGTNSKKIFQAHLKKNHDIIYREEMHGYKRETFQQVIDFAMRPNH